MSEIKVVGPYQIEEFIDGGSFADVYRCSNLATGDQYACKVVEQKQICEDSKTLENFGNELQIHSQMAHPGIIRLHDIQLDTKNIYLIMELSPMGNLEQLIQKEGGISEEKAAMYFKQIMEAVKYIHDLGVAHRDITLKNILLSSDGYAKLSDFGLCKRQEENSYLSTTCGTFVYVPPEILTQQKYDGFKADIWSAGICLYAMTSNHLPWMIDEDIPADRVWEETQRQICSGEITFDDNQSELLRDLLTQMLCVDPEFRIEAEECLCHPWVSYAEEYDEPTCPEQNSDLKGTVEVLLRTLHQR